MWDEGRKTCHEGASLGTLLDFRVAFHSRLATLGLQGKLCRGESERARQQEKEREKERKRERGGALKNELQKKYSRVH